MNRTLQMAIVQMALTATPCLAAQKEEVIFNFLFSTSGHFPVAPLVEGKGGILYGTTGAAPTQHDRHVGTVFSLTPPSGGDTNWTQQTLYNFTGANGNWPRGGLTLDPSGVLYGTTSEGGPSGGGTVFKLEPPSKGNTNWKQTILAQPSSNPFAGVIRAPNGTLFGTTANSADGAPGTVFSVTPPSNGKGPWTTTTLYSFQGGPDGSTPLAPVVQQAGTGILYGTTSQGGNGSGVLCTSDNIEIGCGTVFQLTPPANGQTQWTETVIYAFQGGADGATPLGGLVMDASGALYGTTVAGGASLSGVVFKLVPPAGGQSEWTELPIYAFRGPPNDGFSPFAGVTLAPDSSLFGTTNAGGKGVYGTVYKLTPPAAGQGIWTEKILHAFHHQDGRNPQAPIIIDGSGNLFGTTRYGGTGGGTAFEIPR